MIAARGFPSPDCSIGDTQLTLDCGLEGPRLVLPVLSPSLPSRPPNHLGTPLLPLAHNPISNKLNLVPTRCTNAVLTASRGILNGSAAGRRVYTQGGVW